MISDCGLRISDLKNESQARDFILKFTIRTAQSQIRNQVAPATKLSIGIASNQTSGIQQDRQPTWPKGSQPKWGG